MCFVEGGLWKTKEVSYRALIASIRTLIPDINTDIGKNFSFDIGDAVKITKEDWTTILTHTKSGLNLEWLSSLTTFLPVEVQLVIQNQNNIPKLMGDIKKTIASMNLDLKFPCNDCIPATITTELAAKVKEAVNNGIDQRSFCEGQILQKFENVRELQKTYMDKRGEPLKTLKERTSGLNPLKPIIAYQTAKKLMTSSKELSIQLANEALVYQDPYVYALMNLQKVAECMTKGRDPVIGLLSGTISAIPAQELIQFYEKNSSGKFDLVPVTSEPPQ